MAKIPGSAFRDRIAAMLRLKYADVSTEVRLEMTSADVLFTDDTNPTFPRRIAVEAKDWSGPLRSNQIARIYQLYQPSIDSGSIDHLWIIGNHNLASSPLDSISKLKKVAYSQYDQFLSSLMNFGPVLLDNQLAFQNHESSKNFILSRIKSSEKTLEDYSKDWLKSNTKALIVYGGYGLGKTSFSLYFASKLSRWYLDGNNARIPIRISLGGLYTKQDLTSLICSTLSGSETGANVKDFSYNMFLQLNNIGQFLLILDGFDEMRHAMDIDDFVFTFEQMRPLFDGNAKVIVLGRPDSFFDIQEENAVLSAMFDDVVGSLDKVELSFLSKSEIDGYLNNFMANSNEIDINIVNKFGI